MTKFSIEYNPYLAECVFKINGIRVSDGSKIGAKSKNRLQVLLGESGNWKGLLEEIASKCDDPEIELFFKGRRIDYDDLVYEVDRYEKRKEEEGKKERKQRFYLQKCEEVKKDEDISGELDKIFAEIKNKNIPEFETKNIFGKDVFDLYEDAQDGIFEVSVIATMSSGKSTLVNSLLHKELLPSSQMACTATITRILDNDNMSGYQVKCYDKKEQLIYSSETVTLTELTKYNADKNIKYIDIEGSIPAISSGAVRLCLQDTPGPNNSQDKEHEELTRAVIRRTNSVVLYVMNATQLEIKDDQALLKEISHEMKMSGRQSRDRFIFVVNKCDELDEERGETVDTILKKVIEYLKGFEIFDPVLIAVSARTALLIRKKREDEECLSRQERKEVTKECIEDWIKVKALHFDEHAYGLSPTIYGMLEEEIEEHRKNKDEEMEALIHTGIPVLEKTICEYIDKYAYPMKIQDAVKDIVGILDGLEMEKQYRERISKGEVDLENIRKQIDAAEKKFRESRSIYEKYEKVVDEIKIDVFDEEQQMKKIELELANLTKDYDNKEKIDKSEADAAILFFQNRLESYQRNCESSLNHEIEDNIFGKCNDMLQEYSDTVEKILDGLLIEGYDFRKANSFRKLKISNIEDLKKQNEQERYREEKRWKDNPERSGFWGKFKFWKPKQISYTVSVKDGVDVNLKKIIVNIMNEFAKNIKWNIHNLFESSTEQMKEYKKTFKSNIEALYSEVEKIFEKLKEDTQSREKIEELVAENKELADWVSKEDKKIRELLSF